MEKFVDLMARKNGELVRKIRGENSQRDFGEFVGINPKTIHRREEGFRDMSVLFEYPISEKDLQDHILNLLVEYNRHFTA